MDILIKNIEKPKNCLECQFYLSEYDYCHALKDNLSQKEWETKSRCPLVELPPHGELIERSAVIDIIRTNPLMQSDTVKVGSLVHRVENAPTIVEAST